VADPELLYMLSQYYYLLYSLFSSILHRNQDSETECISHLPLSFLALWHFTTRESGVVLVMRSVASSGRICLCLFVMLRLLKLVPECLFFDMQVHLQNLQVIVYQGHRVKVKVT